MKVIISSGHGKYVRGASGVLDEVDEARRVVEHLADELKIREVEVDTYHDNVSTTQDENLRRIVDYHNAQVRDLDISIHFNAYIETDKPMGTECLYVTQGVLAADVAAAIAACGLINRGAKKRTDLYFLNNTEMPSILVEVCFVDSSSDANIYTLTFDEICEDMANVISGKQEQVSEAEFNAVGMVSSFGGPLDAGVDADEGLAFIYEIDQAPHLFLPYQPEGTTGLARRLNPNVHYIACRWDYEDTPKSSLLEDVALVRSTKTGIALTAFPADWGPHQDTGRVADISPGLMIDLGIGTDDEVEVTFPYKGG